MASTEGIPYPVVGVLQKGGCAGVVGALKNGMNPSQVNSFRISAVIDRLARHIRAQAENDVGAQVGSYEFLNLCLSLARGIDYAIANLEVPNRAQELPLLLKQVYHWNKNDAMLQTAIMVLMISVKNACQSGWFSDDDSVELINLAKEIVGNFCSVPNFNSDPSSSLSVITAIMSRFFPRMKMGHIFVFLESKPGYDAYVSDFQISKDLKSAQGERIRLFVAQMDSFETSSCLISPPKVNFFLNGKGVEMRTNHYMDSGPQIPTVVKHLLKYGSNLLQAVGEFNGNYIIAVALTSEVPDPDVNVLQDYEQHASAVVDPDPEIIEGPSRISLNCPISFKRIKTPVKGYTCKHIQCFDFDNYIDINSRRPSWRCPHCNQPVCFTDLRIDQKMVRILKEVGPKGTDIVFSSDGSWNSAIETDDASKKPEDKTCNSGQYDSPQSFSMPDEPDDIMDLTLTDDVLEDFVTHEAEDREINPTGSLSQPMTPTIIGPNPHTTNTSQSRPHLETDWSGIYLSTFEVGSSNSQSNTSNYVASPHLPNPTTSASHEHHETFLSDALIPTSVLPSQMSLPNTVHLQQYQFGNQAITGEYGRFPSHRRNVTRTPNAVQALPVQSPAGTVQQRSIYRGNPVVQSSFSTVSQSPHLSPTISNSTVHTNSNQVPSHMVSSPLHQYPRLQNQSHTPSAYRVYNERPSSTQQMANNRMPPHSNHQSPTSMHTPTAFSSLPQNQQAHLVAAANRAIQMSVDGTHSVAPATNKTVQLSSDQSRPSVQHQRVVNIGPTSEPLPYDPADQNWRPAGRMRGALTGQAYSDALNQFIIRPNQQAQAQSARPISMPTGVSPEPHLQTSVPNYNTAEPSSRTGMR